MLSPPAPVLVRSYAALNRRVSQILSHSLDAPDVAQALAQVFVPILSDACIISLVGDQGAERYAAAHVNPDKAALLEAVPPATVDPWLEAVLAGAQPVVQPQLDATVWTCVAQSPEQLECLQALGSISSLTVPLRTAEHAVGALTLLCSDSGRHFDTGHAEAVADLAIWVATALNNMLMQRRIAATELKLAEAQARATQAERHGAILADASKSLADSLDQVVSLRGLLRIIVGPLGDMAAADVLRPNGDLQQAAAHATTPADLTLLHQLRGYTAGPLCPSLAYVAIERGELQLLHLRGHCPEPPLAASPPFRLLESSAVHTLVAVPLCSHGRCLGAITVGLSTPGRQFTPDDLQLLQELARRAAGALDNARSLLEAQRAVAVRDEFLSIASHELRTPLTALELQLGHIERILERDGTIGGQLTERFATKVDRSCRQAARLASLVDNLLDTTRISAGRLTLKRDKLHLQSLLQAVSLTWRDEAQRAGCLLQVECAADVTGEWDAQRLEQVFNQLLSNAVRYGAGHPITMAVRAHDGWVEIAVRDGGRGIDAEAVERIFGRFERAASCRQFGGLGLGLFIVRQMVEAHGGRVSVEPYCGSGAVFTVHLPQSASSKASPMIDTSECVSTFTQAEDSHEQSCSVQPMR